MERYLVLLWFKRFDTVNKGIMRLFGVCLIPISFLVADKSDSVLIFVTCYVILILCFRILLWIYDGIIGKE